MDVNEFWESLSSVERIQLLAYALGGITHVEVNYKENNLLYAKLLTFIEKQIENKNN